MPLFSTRAELLPMKAHFFLFNAGTAPIVPFMPVYAKQLGFSSALVGTIYTILPFTGMLTKPIVGAISDRFRCHKLLFIISILITIVSFFAIMYIPPIEGKLIGDVHCTNVYSYMRICPPGNRTDRYMVEKVIAEHKDNTSITCKMECVGSPEFTAEVCSSWGFKHYCSTTQPSRNYIALAEAHALKEGLDPNAGKTANIKTTTPAPITSFQDLKLEGALQPFHTNEVAGCIFIRLTGVRDLTSNNYQDEIAPTCTKTVITTCKFDCDSPALADIGEDRDLETPVVHYQFWALVACLILSWMGMAAVVSIGDTLCFGLLGDNPNDYGYQRLWGSVGWGYFAIIAGLLVDMFSSGLVLKNYTPVFYLMAVILTLDLTVATRIKQTEHKPSLNILKDVSKMLMNMRIIVFLLWCIIVGMCTALIWNFLFWHLENLGKGQDVVWMKTLQGLVMSVQCFGGELPFFFISGWMLKKIGHVNAMSLVLFAFGIRFLLYSMLVDPWWCLPIELLNGVTFGTFYATMASYASIIAPPGTEATIQGMVGAIFEGIGLSSGSFIAGLLFYYMDGAMVFRMCGLIVLSFCCIHACIQFYLGRHGSNIASTSGKEFSHSARYASPNDAISMLSDQNELTNS